MQIYINHLVSNHYETNWQNLQAAGYRSGYLLYAIYLCPKWHLARKSRSWRQLLNIGFPPQRRQLLNGLANLFECMAMFYFAKRLLVFRIITEPRTDLFLLLCRFPIFLHHVFNVVGFRENKERLLLSALK